MRFIHCILSSLMILVACSLIILTEVILQDNQYFDHTCFSDLPSNIVLRERSSHPNLSPVNSIQRPIEAPRQLM